MPEAPVAHPAQESCSLVLCSSRAGTRSSPFHSDHSDHSDTEGKQALESDRPGFHPRPPPLAAGPQQSFGAWVFYSLPRHMVNSCLPQSGHCTGGCSGSWPHLVSWMVEGRPALNKCLHRNNVFTVTANAARDECQVRSAGNLKPGVGLRVREDFSEEMTWKMTRNWPGGELETAVSG